MATGPDSPRARLLVGGILHPGEVDRFTAGAVATDTDELPGLRLRVQAYLSHVERMAATHPLIDLEVASRVADVLQRILDEPDQLDSHGRQMIRGAVEYFVLDRDGNGDLTDVIGFDDDTRVVNAVVESLGRADLLIKLT